MTGRPQQPTECMHVGRNGFWGIFLLAAWPNALFDLCGICCGHFLTPFWVFFGATFCGKALVKVQCREVLSSQLTSPLCSAACRCPHKRAGQPRRHHACEVCIGAPFALLGWSGQGT